MSRYKKIIEKKRERERERERDYYLQLKILLKIHREIKMMQ